MEVVVSITKTTLPAAIRRFKSDSSMRAISAMADTIRDSAIAMVSMVPSSMMYSRVAPVKLSVGSELAAAGTAVGSPV